jgi:arylsulfatase A-like enzyme
MKKKPNILLINIDDLGWTDLSFMGSQFYESPRIDAFTKEGIRFTSAYASAANCAPSRANMITGVYGDKHGIWTVKSSERGDSRLRRIIPQENKTELPVGMPTLAAHLQKLGYHTCMVGKWHVSENPLEYGFDENHGGCHAGHPQSYFAPYKNLNLQNCPEGEYLPERLTNEVCNYLDQHKDEPFFIYYATYLVHTPLKGKDEKIDKYKQKLNAGYGNKQHNNPVYAAMVEALDDAVGKVLDHLETTGLAENTLVLLTSDNGGVSEISRQTPLRGGKGAYYEGGIRVPMAVRWPGNIPSNSISNFPVSNIDFFPTLLKLAGANLEPLDFEGQDISEVLLGNNPGSNDRELFWYFPIYLESHTPTESHDPLFRTRPGSVLRKGPWKIHHYYEDNAYELYFLPDDIGERNECSKENPEIFSQLKKRLSEKIDSLGFSYTPLPNPEFDSNYEQQCLDSFESLEQPEVSTEEQWYRVMKLID